jgi:uncharacterized membrane protein
MEMPPAPAGITPPVDRTATSEDGQTTAVTNSSDNPDAVSVSPPVNPTSNASSSAGSRRNVRQASPSDSDDNQMNQGLPDLEAIERDARRTGTYTGALIMNAALVPGVAALISATAFVVQWPTGIALPDWLRLAFGTPLLLGSISTLIAWLLLALILRRFTAVDRMDMSSYGLLLNRLSALNAQLSVLNPGPSTIPLTGTLANKEVLDYRNTISKKLVKRSLAWVTASGYINLWKEMHNAEEALIDVLPQEAVIADALYDELRIQDSKIETGDELLKKLRIAVTILDPSVRAFLQSPPPDMVATNVTSERQARSVLREVRHALNEFRDERWEAIVRVRNQFVCTTIFTGLILYVLLQFAILAGASRSAIISATAFYLVGALVGLFYRLYNESQTSNAIDDYRLALARLAATPLYCGLAAVGGVLIAQKITSVADIFDPKNLLSGLIIAALFGLTPNLLIDTLQKQTETYKNDLKSTAATQRQGVKIP